ncbi:hypothetical protein CTI12_AA521440 [Artemisia annua]|uniref:Uncharacterized protein n=1 Tax=Artemisia annua TaxID=35608 RepID=A0A2U1L314_ARTAN|nr:hypothetical protein CTI12_AA521440 [Artemisia annua]
MPRIPVGADDGSNDATIPSTRKRKHGTSIDSQTKQKAVKPTLPRFNARRNKTQLNLHCSQHNRLLSGVANPNGPGFYGEVGGSGPSEPTSVAGQASGVNAVGR